MHIRCSQEHCFGTLNVSFQLHSIFDILMRIKVKTIPQLETSPYLCAKDLLNLKPSVKDASALY